ncbi:uncharacterized protein DUF1214 [Actinocorallia herbida]|uniref:Uncharacterized protein DUF1214 n=1 Tax=Actinocorallia herbida TaxID=58109 RepID=A0A3N1CW53_9ACTN|nr:DUF1214 domain-containing protein [Actinocorallia herbida]ROO85455.1 uncharacterized protein DUF1214 [Actinocorallia herbida]
MNGRQEVEAWTEVVEALRTAGEKIAASTEGLGEEERADGFRALLRGLHHQLARFEVDRERPELVEFNGWRQKFFMDNPDTRYWVADVRDDRCYRITGHPGGSVYQSVTAYASASGGVGTTARIDSDAIALDADGGFTLLVGGPEPGDGTAWLPLPEGAKQLWVRHFHDDVAADAHGWAAIEPVAAPAAPPPPIDPARFSHGLSRLAKTVGFMPGVFGAVQGQVPANAVHHWAEMANGAAYTEPGIHYLRGAWKLEPGQALVVEGATVPCRHWSVLLYSRFLNSLDHRHRQVSRTGGTATAPEGTYRFVLAAEDPGVPDWLDTEGRESGLFVLRFLQAEREPVLPTVRVCPVGALEPR